MFVVTELIKTAPVAVIDVQLTQSPEYDITKVSKTKAICHVKVP